MKVGIGRVALHKEEGIEFVVGLTYAEEGNVVGTS